ncbi:hypothetical protein [Tianweitania sediminis]|uniref:Uncharacterized protein n=1 Tax=Tianweitania sediminis TaxID=1502156 RepID=A0A8J7UM05_9HYPH|nr:hypothetical protein [Tianweitania sediminis]MBP0439837.1 hypothetical protein [Tianweitania sediminis]
MQRAVFSFVLVALLTMILAAGSLFLAGKGYPFGAVGLRRLDGIAAATTFAPLASVYFLSAALMMLLPLRPAAFVLTHAADILFWAAVALLGTVVGLVAAQFAFGQMRAPYALAEWGYLYALAVAACHFLLNSLRRNLLLRTLAFVGLLAAAGFCLVW